MPFELKQDTELTGKSFALDISNSAKCIENPQDSHQRQFELAKGISSLVSPVHSSSYDFEGSQLTSKSKLNSFN